MTDTERTAKRNELLWASYDPEQVAKMDRLAVRFPDGGDATKEIEQREHNGWKFMSRTGAKHPTLHFARWKQAA